MTHQEVASPKCQHMPECTLGRPCLIGVFANGFASCAASSRSEIEFKNDCLVQSITLLDAIDIRVILLSTKSRSDREFGRGSKTFDVGAEICESLEQSQLTRF